MIVRTQILSLSLSLSLTHKIIYILFQQSPRQKIQIFAKVTEDSIFFFCPSTWEETSKKQK